jgi:hypothetical protein
MDLEFMVDDLSLVGPRTVCAGRWTLSGLPNRCP